MLLLFAEAASMSLASRSPRWMFDVVSRISPPALYRAGGVSAVNWVWMLLADIPWPRGIAPFDRVENNTPPTRTQPLSMLDARTSTAAAAKSVRALNVPSPWPMQNSSSMIDVDSSSTNTTSPHGWQGSCAVPVVLGVAVVLSATVVCVVTVVAVVLVETVVAVVLVVTVVAVVAVVFVVVAVVAVVVVVCVATVVTVVTVAVVWVVTAVAVALVATVVAAVTVVWPVLLVAAVAAVAVAVALPPCGVVGAVLEASEPGALVAAGVGRTSGFASNVWSLFNRASTARACLRLSNTSVATAWGSFLPSTPVVNVIRSVSASSKPNWFLRICRSFHSTSARSEACVPLINRRTRTSVESAEVVATTIVVGLPHSPHVTGHGFPAGSSPSRSQTTASRVAQWLASSQPVGPVVDSAVVV